MTNNSNYLIAIYSIFYVTIVHFSTTLHAAEEKKSTPKPALTVTLTQAQAAQLPVRLSANGNIAAWQEASIGTEAQGLRLTELRADVGDRVRAGQLLAVFASDGVQADLAQARAALAEAQVAATAATQEADRARAVQNTGAVSAQQISQLLNAEQSAKARVETARAQITGIDVRLKNTRVLAPDAGIISARSASVGSIGGGANGELFRLIRKGRLEWRAEVTASELGRVKPGLAVAVTTAAGAQVIGKVRMIGPQVDAQTRAALVYVDLDLGSTNKAGQFSAGPPQGSRRAAEPKLAPSGGSAAHAVASVGAILPGMYAKGEFELGQTGATTLPQTAIVMRDGFAYIYPVGADNRVAQLKVQTGRTVGDRVEILSKLPADARVVAVGAGFLNDGDLVRVAPASPAAAATNASK